MTFSPQEEGSYLEVENDGPDKAEHDGRPAVDQVCRVDVYQLDALAGQESERRVGVGQEVRPAKNTPALHRL